MPVCVDLSFSPPSNNDLSGGRHGLAGQQWGVRGLLLHHLLVGRTLQLPRRLPCLHDLGIEEKYLFWISFRFILFRSREQPPSWLDCTSANTSSYPWSSSPSCRPSRSSSSGPPSSPLARASAFSPQGSLLLPKNFYYLSSVLGTRCTACTSFSSSFSATSSLLSLSSFAFSGPGTWILTYHSPFKPFFGFQDFCSKENLLDLSWGASSL